MGIKGSESAFGRELVRHAVRSTLDVASLVMAEAPDLEVAIEPGWFDDHRFNVYVAARDMSVPHTVVTIRIGTPPAEIDRSIRDAAKAIVGRMTAA